MRRIELLSLTLENFRSFRAATTIALSPTAGLKFVSGDNRVQPRLGANGAGKSTLWDALSYCLYNSSVRGIRASELTSWGAKQSVVKTAWLIDGESVEIERTSAPDRLLINGQRVEQAAVDRLIGLSRKRFLQGVVFGQAVPLFVDLSVPDRGALLDEVLDLGIWLKLSEAAGQKHGVLSRELAQADQAIAFLKGKLEGLQDTAVLEREIAAWEAQLERRVDEAIVQVEQEEARLLELQDKLAKAISNENGLAQPNKLRQRIDECKRKKVESEISYRSVFEKISQAQKTLDFYRHTKTCPTCSQAIPPAMRSRQEQQAQTDISRLKVQTQSTHGGTARLNEEINQLEAEYSTLTRKRDFFLEQRAIANADIVAQHRVIDAATHAVELIATAENPHRKRLDALIAERASVLAEQQKAEGIKRRTQGAAMRADFWRGAFKRVRLFLVKHVLSQLELETQTAAAALGLAGWRIAFATELETKSGSLRPGIHIQVSSPDASAPWEAWSGGEGQRIRLAVALGLASMIQRLAGISIGFEVWDEPSAWLSPEGIEDLLDCLKHRVEMTGKSLWLCDHRALIYAGFDEIWQVSKTQSGSSVKLLSAMEG